eukprot:1251023-Amorphochlora_amoeboformis.AAC.2
MAHSSSRPRIVGLILFAVLSITHPGDGISQGSVTFTGGNTHLQNHMAILRVYILLCSQISGCEECVGIAR